MKEKITIGQLASLTGVPRKTIRYYEDIGVLPSPERGNSRYRLYSSTDVRRLELIRRARNLDMSLSEMRELVKWADTRTCGDFQEHFQEMVRQKQKEIEKRIADLEALKEDLQHLEIHFTAPGVEISLNHDHTMLECSPDTCKCLGVQKDSKLSKKGG